MKITISIPDPLLLAIRERAQANDLSISKLIVTLVNKGLEAERTSTTPIGNTEITEVLIAPTTSSDVNQALLAMLPDSCLFFKNTQMSPASFFRRATVVAADHRSIWAMISAVPDKNTKEDSTYERAWLAGRQQASSERRQLCKLSSMIVSNFDG